MSDSAIDFVVHSTGIAVMIFYFGIIAYMIYSGIKDSGKPEE